MASKAFINQALTLSMCQGLMEMVWMQQYERQANNKTFAGMFGRLKRDVGAAYNVLMRVDRQQLSFMDMTRVHAKVDGMKRDKQIFPDGRFSAMLALSYCRMLVDTQLELTRGAKWKAFDAVSYRLKEFERYFDRNKSFDPPDLESRTERLEGVMQCR